MLNKKLDRPPQGMTVLARRSPPRVALSGRHPRASHHPLRSSAGLPERAPAQRYPETHHTTFLAPRLRHASAGDRHRCTQDPATDGSSQHVDDCALLPTVSCYVQYHLQLFDSKGDQSLVLNINI